MKANSDLLRALLNLDFDEREKEIRGLSEVERREIRYFWKLWARRSQLAPPAIGRPG